MAAPQKERTFFRLPTDIPIEVAVPGTKAPLRATLSEISEGGCRVTAAVMLLRDSQIKFGLPREGQSDIPIGGVIKVIDVKPDNRTFTYGVEYVGIRPADRDAIYQFIVAAQRRAIEKRVHAENGSEAPGRVRAVQQRETFRVKKPFRVSYSLGGMRAGNPAIALDVSRSGMRIVVDRQLSQDRAIELQFTLPNDMLDVLTRRVETRDSRIFGRTVTYKEVRAKAFDELRVQAKILPGVEKSGTKFLYSVVFSHPKPQVVEEIERYVHAGQLMELQEKKRSAARAAS